MRKKPPHIREIQAQWWALAYFLSIPIYAFVYFLLPQLDSSQFHFYHASSQYEKALYDDAAVTTSQLQDVLTQNFVARYSGDSTQVDGWNFSIKDLVITGLKPAEDTVEIRFRLRLQKETSAGPIVAQKSFRATTPILGQDIIDLSLGTVCKPLSFDSDRLIIFNDESIGFDTIFVPRNEACYSPALAIPKELNERLKDFWRASRGFPTKTSGNFGRMLYFSVVTITTTGYGDIYPISNTARVLVAFESISGVFFAGMFLYAIVQKNKK